MDKPPASREPFRVRNAAAAVLCACAGAAVFQFFGNANHGYIDTRSLFWWWSWQWMNPASETQHGWLVLALAGWLFVRGLRAGREQGDAADHMEKGEGRREKDDTRLGSLRVSPSVPFAPVVRGGLAALAAMVGGLALHALGFAAQQARISILALLLFTWGVLRLAGGRRWGVAAAFPLVFMLFAVPINVLDSLGFWLRLWVVHAGTAIAHAAGINVIQNGTLLLSPEGRYAYDVAAACSGVRSLTAMAALSLLIGYLGFRSWTRRGFILLLCFPLIYVANVARIGAIIVAAHAGGPQWGDRAHAVMGYVVFAIVLGGVLAATALLRRPPRRWKDGRKEAPPPEPDRVRGLRSAPGSLQEHPAVAPADASPAPRGTSKATEDRSGPASARRHAPHWIAALVVPLALGEMALLHRVSTLPPRGRAGILLSADGREPVALPGFAGREWVGMPAAVTAVERDILPPDTGYSRMNYVATNRSRRVFLSIVLSGRDRSSLHRPEICLVGQGWTIRGRQEHLFSYPRVAGADFPATVLRVEHANPDGRLAPQVVVYWFVGGDRIVATPWQRMLADGWNRLTRARADRWAYVLMQTDAADGQEAAVRRIQSVLDETLPAFQRPLGLPTSGDAG